MPRHAREFHKRVLFLGSGVASRARRLRLVTHELNRSGNAWGERILSGYVSGMRMNHILVTRNTDKK